MSAGPAQSGKSAPFLLRNPTISKTHVAFGYGGSIWVANREGGELRRLTTAGRESKPALSPDGVRIAFIGEYEGFPGVFVMPLGGGQPQRLTYHPADVGIRGFVTGNIGWLPDGSGIVFRSHRAAFAGDGIPVSQLFTVPVSGGAATAVPLVRAAEGCFSPDLARIAYVPHMLSQRECKRYRGGQTRFIQIAGLTDSGVEARIPRNQSNDFNPMWIGDTVYFLSDRNGPVTLFAYDVRSGTVREVLENKGLDVKSAAATSGAIVYEQFGSLHLLELDSGKNRALDIRPAGDFHEVRARTENVASFLTTASPGEKINPKLSPNGTRAVFGVRGRIVTVPAEKGDIRVLTQAPGVAARDPAWSPDGESIAYFSDEAGEYGLHISRQRGGGAVRKIDLGRPPSFYYHPRWSPDSRKIAYTDARLNYWYVDLERRTPVCVDTSAFTDPRVRISLCDFWLTWSPDSRWLAYIKQLPGQLHAAFLYSIEQGKSFQLTDGMSDVLHIAFDRGGQYLYFTASTDAIETVGFMDMSSFHVPMTRSVYALVLSADAGSPVPPLSDEETGDASQAQPTKSSGRAAAEKIEIHTDNITERIVRLPIPARNYNGIRAGASGVLFLVEGPQADELPLAFLEGAPVLKVHKFDLATRKLEEILDQVSYFDLTPGGVKMLYAKQQGKDRRWFITTAEKVAGGAQEHGLLKLDPIEITVDPRAQWRQMYEETWREERDFFYDPGLHGLSLEHAKKTYEPFLENVVTRDELTYLFDEMLSNLTCMHMNAFGPNEVRDAGCLPVGLLGADYTVDSGRYRFARVYRGDPWSQESRAPLCEPGATVRAGEYLLAVNDREVRPSADVHSYFTGTAGKQIVLRVGPESDGSRSREVTVVPIGNEYPLRYFAWVEDNRRKVDELTGGRVAYIHVPNTVLGGYAAFKRYLLAQVRKDAAIIDDRFNSGGKAADYIIDSLRDPLGHWQMREGSDLGVPGARIRGPKVMLINEMATSCGELLPWMFRKAGIGPLIGTRTWGGLVGFGLINPDLIDGGFICTPNLAFYSSKGWEVENCGVQPDIEVAEDPQAARLGRDVQLEKAIEVVMGLLKSAPRQGMTQRPPYPSYAGE